MDRQGSVRLVFDTAGSIVASTDFDAYGKLVSGSRSDRYGYTGREWDGTLELQYSRARVYDPAAGRFVGGDPIGFSAGDYNLYRYVGNAPTYATDPSGLQGFWDEVGSVWNYVAGSPGAAASEFGRGLSHGARNVGQGIGGTALEFGRVPLDVIGYNAQNVLNAGAAAAGSDTRFDYHPVSNTFQQWSQASSAAERAQIGLGLVRDVGTLGMWPLGTAIGELIRDGDVDKFSRATGAHGTGTLFLGIGLKKLERGSCPTTPKSAPGKTFHENPPISYGRMQTPDGWKPPSITKNEHGMLTNGAYTLGETKMMPHTTGSLTKGKSQFLHHVNEKELVLDSAAYADKAGLWNNVGKAKIVFYKPIGVHAGTGQTTNVLNIYRTQKGLVHGAPGSPGG